ncbi:3-methyladenine DNA glycosylase [Occultella glacieicola]|uniref:3-methyladenine DNA glycosylase n=1 Tax=Occultella glacieicola TaxID=2518684 RepID=A0ABY2EAC6_9MICO|nr:3-methyladenine DNA glycosylase [Occultella glacieicola]TDE95815.1 3-methyladenine DNA glycosylase [Occultella glacieicola]
MSATSPTRSAPDTTVLAPLQWRALEASHAERADAHTAGHRRRRSRHEAHPVHDFLFTYYPTKPAQLRRWHPGAGVTLLDAPDRASARWYTRGRVPGSATVDVGGYLEQRRDTVVYVHDLLGATRSRPGQYGCFGLHEWAMVYRQDRAQVRHRGAPLRLGGEGTDAVVESHQLRCTHFDAYRFFTPGAVDRNAQPLSRAEQPASEQPGCLHAGMDCYKWATKLGPVVPGDLLLDTFELAWDIRELDMRASPYDLTDWGYDPVPIETSAGKATYVAAQRAFAQRSDALRVRLLEVTGAVLHGA